MASRIRIDPKEPDGGVIELVVSMLERGGLVVYPTDTLYGLGCDATNAEAVERVFAIKGRRRDQPLPVLVSGVRMVEEYADEIPRAARTLAERFWNGALTIVVRSKRLRHLGSEKAGFRAPAHEVPLEVILKLGRPIVGTSANISGTPGALDPDEIERQLGNRVDIILDCGKLTSPVPSTVVDVSVHPPRLIREGAIPKEAIDAALSEEG